MIRRVTPMLAFATPADAGEPARSRYTRLHHLPSPFLSSVVKISCMSWYDSLRARTLLLACDMTPHPCAVHASQSHHRVSQLRLQHRDSQQPPAPCPLPPAPCMYYAFQRSMPHAQRLQGRPHRCAGAWLPHLYLQLERLRLQHRRI